MNILFLTLLDFKTLDEQNIYTDLLRCFVAEGHSVVVISPVERRYKEETYLISEENYKILKLKIGNTQKTNLIEKGISTVLLEHNFKSALKIYFSDVKFDLILYSTPPITFANVIKYIKVRDNARAYLLLKDIFPQNAVDLGMFSKKNPIYKFFRRKEKTLYAVSDKIGCMSDANVRFVLNNNPDISPEKVEVCPNSIEVKENNISDEEKHLIRERYGLPVDKTVFIYGGNLGKPQGIDFVVEALKTQTDNDKAFFLIVGSGTEFDKINAFCEESKAENIKLFKSVSRDEFDKLLAACDVGMIFLDKRFTIPNFPSRLLSYMQAAIPTYAVTDVSTDVGEVIKKGDFGWWSESGKTENFVSVIDEILSSDLNGKGINARNYLLENYTVEAAYKTIMEGNK